MGTAAIVSCESQKGELYPSNVRRVTDDGTSKIIPRWQVHDKGKKPDHAKGNRVAWESAESAQWNESSGRYDLDWSWWW